MKEEAKGSNPNVKGVLWDEKAIAKVFVLLDEYNAQIPDSVRHNPAAFSDLDAIFSYLDAKLYLNTDLNEEERCVIINRWASNSLTDYIGGDEEEIICPECGESRTDEDIPCWNCNTL